MFLELSEDQRPQERMESLGGEALSDAELLAVIIRKGTRNKDILTLCHEILSLSGGLKGLLRMTREDLYKIKGMGRVKALQLLSALEIAKRLIRKEGNTQPILDDPDKVYEWLLPECEGLSVEKFWVICLNRKNRLIRSMVVSSGTATASLAHPREIYREAIRQGATGIICVHNHPSGDPSPSQADIKITRQLSESSKILQIDLLDHVVIGNTLHDPLGLGYYSFAESGFL